ncbi:MAG: glycosyltransferase family 4 protein [Candidatus Paceibacteria bacterium]
MLFIPAGIVPLIHPRKQSFAVVHGLEYEYFPQSYSLFQFWHLVTFTRWSAWRSNTVFVPSQNTKNDLVAEYRVAEEKLDVVYPGLPQRNYTETQTKGMSEEVTKILQTPFVFWIGRKDQRKNLSTLVEAFNQLKAQKDIPTDLTLVLAGAPGEGYEEVKHKIYQSPHKHSIYDITYVSEQERAELYTQARLFVFPSWYEGFGFPILEAQQAGTPVVSSNAASLPEVGESSCLYASPDTPYEFVEQIRMVLLNPEVEYELIEAGHSNVKRFTFAQTAEHILKTITASARSE